MTNELKPQEIIGARLAEMRSDMIRMLMFKLRLEPHDAEDVFLSLIHISEPTRPY